jgi:hypothetical protein
LALIGVARPALAAPSQWAEFTFGSSASASLGTYPQDCAATHNGNRAAIRYANPNSNDTVISIFQLHGTGVPSGSLATIGGVQNGVAMKSGVATDLSDPVWGYWPSDRIELTNNIGVSIGAGLMGSSFAPANAQSDETYIEVFDVGSTAPAFLKQFVIPDPLQPPPQTQAEYDVEHAGNANDVAITRDGAWAVVNSDNWIHVVNLANPKGPNGLIGFNIGKYAYTQGEDPIQWDWPCSPNQAVDSIALTNDRAVVTTARKRRAPALQVDVPTTWVYIIDFNGANGPEIVLEHDLAPDPDWEPLGGNDQDPPHDVAITPHTDLQLGAVPLSVVTTRHSVGLYNLDTNAILPNRLFEATDQRLYQRQVDSVEMTGDRAVVISDRKDSAAFVETWRVRVFGLNASTGLVTLTNGFYEGDTANGLNRAHDLAIDKGFDKALIRTSTENVIITSIQTPPFNFTSLVGTVVSDAHAYLSFTPGGSDSFSSDSVAISAEQAGGVLMAASIGAKQATTGAWVGYTDIIQLAPTLSITQVAIVPDSQSPVGCVPLDLAMSPITNQLVVRSSDPYFFTPSGSPQEVDVVFVSLTPGVGITAQFPGNGYQLGMDSLAAPATGYVNTNKRVLSITQDPITGSPGFDYNHIVR